MLAVSYARVSSKEQEREGYSIPAQLRLIREYAHKKGYRIAETFVDIESAKTAGREAFGEMIKYIRKYPGIDAIICHKVDRMCRNFRDYVTIDDLGVKPLFVEEEFPDTAAGKLTFGMKVLLAKHFIDNLSEEVKKGMREKAEQGEFPGPAPLGYLNNTETHLVEVDPKRSPLVRRLFERYASGNYSLDQLRKLAFQEGLTYRRSGKKLTKSSVEHILKNPFYYGYFRWNGVLYQGKHQPMISKALFHRVRGAFESHNKPEGRRRTFPYTGLVTCGNCGCAVTAEIKKGQYVYYHCTRYRGNCDGPYLRQEAMEEQFGKLVKGVQIDQRTADWIAGALKSSLEADRRHHRETLRSLKAKEQEILQRMDQAYQDKLEGNISEEFWKRISEQWQEELTNIQEGIRIHEEGPRDYVVDGVRILELANRSYDMYLRQSPFERRRLLNALLSNCTLDGTTLCPTYRKPLDLLAEGLSSGNWLPG